MLLDIVEMTWLLENDYYNPKLDELKNRFKTYYMTNEDEIDHNDNSPEAIKRNIGCVIDFYKRFVIRMKYMMESYPSCDVICFEGP